MLVPQRCAEDGGGAAAAAARGAAQTCPKLKTLGVALLQTETFRWARCKEAAPLPRLQRVGLPLPEALLDVLEPALAWEDLQVRWHTTCRADRACPCPCCSVALCGRKAHLSSIKLYIWGCCVWSLDSQKP